MPEVQLRKRVIVVEEVFHEGGPVAATPLRRGAALAVIHNPFAGKYVPEIAGFMEDLNPLGFHQHQPGRRIPSMMSPTGRRPRGTKHSANTHTPFASRRSTFSI